VVLSYRNPELPYGLYARTLMVEEISIGWNVY